MGIMTRRQVLQAAAGAAAVVPTVLQLANAASSNASAGSDALDVNTLPRVKQNLVKPPFVPEHDQIAQGGPKIIEIELVVHEGKEVIDGIGTEAHILSFNGSVPGPLVICHEGDYVEMTLKNPKENIFAHNIDFHASTGALGGGALTNVQPGEEVVLRYKAIKPGTFIYHCAPGGSMIPYHVVSGMNGAVMVLPRDGLKDGSGNSLPYDRAYYIGEQDFYIPRDESGAFKKYGSAAESLADTLATMRTLIPSHVVFNGKVGALTGDNALTASVGDTVLFIHSQANRDSRPHLIGGHGDYVWEQGSFADAPATGLETWFIRGGSAGAAMYTFKQPGVYVYLNHNLIEATELGALSHVIVEGEWDNNLMAQIKEPGPITECLRVHRQSGDVTFHKRAIASPIKIKEAEQSWIEKSTNQCPTYCAT